MHWEEWNKFEEKGENRREKGLENRCEGNRDKQPTKKESAQERGM